MSNVWMPNCPEHGDPCMNGCGADACVMREKFAELVASLADLPRPISDPFPFRNHRTVAEVWGLATGGNAS